jgi:hypothetical protein
MDAVAEKVITTMNTAGAAEANGRRIEKKKGPG